MYPFKEIEAKWQEKWETSKVFQVKIDKTKPKYYVLDMFPYPSAQGLHVGHPEGYTASDIVARYKRAKGFNVLHPMGWDAYGLPAEQHAIQTGIHPEITTKKSIETFKRQLKSLGFSYDWSREISTCDPKYYKWTQFIFLKLFERGLAYQTEAPVNWCPGLKTVLANDEVKDGKSERGGHPVEKRMMKQWMLKITEYAEQLLQDLEGIDWPESTKKKQKEWIGKSIGTAVNFSLKGHQEILEIFTTRADTLWGTTFMVMAPEHPFVDLVTTPTQSKKVKKYVKEALGKLDVDRQANTEKTGVFTGGFAINPVSGDEVPIWVADYVLMNYGSGAIMAVPGHDQRDYEFAHEFGLPVTRVIQGCEDVLPYDGPGVCVNSDFINGLEKEVAIAKVNAWLEEKGLGKAQEQYRLRDWLFSRQRYWGEPFPVVHFPKGDTKAVAKNELPVELPEVESYEPDETGKPPLSRAPKKWLEVKKGKKKGSRDMDTMPGAAGSSWYFLRYADPHNEKELCSKEAQEYWMPVDLYVGGPEHAVGHLLYSRFWQKVLFDAGLATHKEPFQRLVHQGMILGEDGSKMSKRLGNVINPDEMVEKYGADSLRLYEMFMGPLERDKPWSTNGLIGVHKFLSKLWRTLHDEDGNFIADESEPDTAISRVAHQTIRKVTEDIETLSFNTSISQLMIFTNELAKAKSCPKAVVKPILQCLAPFAPHIAEELWEKMGEKDMICNAPWPEYDEDLARAEGVNIAIQVNGKTRKVVSFERDVEQKLVEEEAKKIPFVVKALETSEIKKVIFVKNRILNLIIPVKK